MLTFAKRSGAAALAAAALLAVSAPTAQAQIPGGVPTMGQSGTKVFSYDYLKLLTPLSLALWYMDAGVLTSRGEAILSVEGWEEVTQQRVASHLADTWGIKAKLVKRTGRMALVLPKDQAIKLQDYEPWMTGTLVDAELFWRHDTVGLRDPSA